MIMKKIHYIILFCLIMPFYPSSSWTATVEVEVIHSIDNYQPNGTYHILFRLKIPEPWYIHGAIKAESYLIPTKLVFHDSPDLEVKSIRFPRPETKNFEYLSRPVNVYSGTVLVQASLSTGKDVSSGMRIIKGNLSYQACSPTSCMPPEEVPVELAIMIVPPGTPTESLNMDLFLSAGKERGGIVDISMDRFDTGLLLTLLGLFLGGLALNLTPCIYPLIPITVSYFGGKSDRMSGKTILHGSLYLAGLAVTNSFLGVASALSGSVLGSALQNPAVLIFIACVMTALGFSFFGFWEFRVPLILARKTSKSYTGYFGTFFMGLTLGVLAAPCLGPFILGLLTYVGQRGDPILGFLYFFILSIGIGLPICVLAVFSGAIDRLPVSGDWMIWIKKLLGWVLIMMAAYMISPLVSGKLGEGGLLAGAAVISGVHLGWIDRTGAGKKGVFLYFKRTLSILIFAVSILFLLSTGQIKEGIKWLPYNQKIMTEALEKKRPIILEIYADWCTPCRAMEKRVFNDPEVVSLSKYIACIRLDLTRKRPFQEEAIKRYQVWGAPTIIFINKDGMEERGLRIESYVDSIELLDRMKSFLEHNELLHEYRVLEPSLVHLSGSGF